MRSINRHRPADSPRGDTQATCDLCGQRFYRSELRRNRAGWLVCREDQEERDPVTLSEIIARNAYHRPAVPPNGGGNYTYPTPAIEEFGIDYGDVVSQVPQDDIVTGGDIVASDDGAYIITDDGEFVVYI
jgi:hypothetical protein